MVRTDALIGMLVAAFLLSASSAQAPGTDQEPGQHIHVDLAALPAPYKPRSGAFPPRQISKPDDATLRGPAGFAVNGFAENRGHARNVRVAPNADVFLVAPRDGKTLVMRDGGGRAEDVSTFAKGFRYPHGLAFTATSILVGDLDGVWKLPYSPGDLRARTGQVRITPEGALGDPGGHSTRNVAVSPTVPRYSSLSVHGETSPRNRNRAPQSRRSPSMAAANVPLLPGCAIPSAWRSIRAPMISTQWSANGTLWAMNWFQIT